MKWRFINRSTIRNKISELPLILLLVVCFFLTQSYFGTDNYALLNKVYLGLVILVCAIIIVRRRGVICFKRNEGYLYGMLILPYIIILLYSIFLAILEREISISTVISSSRIPLIMPLASMLIFYYFGSRIVDAIFYAACINYIFYIIAFIQIYGFKGMLNYIALTDLAGIGERPLEVHEITFIFGILILYYMMTWKETHSKAKMIVSIIFCMLGFKRILIVAILIAILVWCLLLFCSKQAERMVKILACCLLIFCMVWIYISATPLLEILALRFNIDLQGRENIIGRLGQHYTLSLFYIGKGTGYVHKVMEAYLASHPYAATSGFHNDILKYYIDLGCIPAALFFFNITYLNTKRILKKFTIRSAIYYIVLITAVIICWSTDNLATYPNFLLVYNIVIMALITQQGRRSTV